MPKRVSVLWKPLPSHKSCPVVLVRARNKQAFDICLKSFIQDKNENVQFAPLSIEVSNDPKLTILGDDQKLIQTGKGYKIS